jgi:hypothetical protein
MSEIFRLGRTEIDGLDRALRRGLAWCGENTTQQNCGVADGCDIRIEVFAKVKVMGVKMQTTVSKRGISKSDV